MFRTATVDPPATPRGSAPPPRRVEINHRPTWKSHLKNRHSRRQQGKPLPTRKQVNDRYQKRTSTGSVRAATEEMPAITADVIRSV
jgi:hypothetical protein